MEIVAIVKNLAEIDELLALGANTLVFESDRFSRSAVLPLSKDKLISAINTTKAKPAKVYIRLNTIIKESDLDELKVLLDEILEAEPDGIVFHDLTIGVILNKMGHPEKGIYQPGTFNTHKQSLTFLSDLKIERATISKEITMDKLVNLIKNNPRFKLSLIGHGSIDMFYSNRKMLSLYHEYKGLAYESDAKYQIAEKSRHTEFYPLIEDQSGTSIFRPKKLHSFKVIDTFKALLFEFFIERNQMTDTEYYQAIKAYASGDYFDFLRQYNDEYDDGVFTDETFLRKGEAK
ncbi:MAG: U32 family peptidase [Candidatus Izemoplasmatales bacterium]|jgi:putative protease